MLFAYLNMGRLSIHPRTQKWRSTMMPNTTFSVNFMRSSFLIVQLWLKLWHSLYSDWLRRVCAIPWWSAVHTLSLEGKSLFNYSKGYTCFAEANGKADLISFSLSLLQRSNVKLFSYLVFWSMIHLSFFVSISFVSRNFQSIPMFPFSVNVFLTWLMWIDGTTCLYINPVCGLVQLEIIYDDTCR